jgi:hypothetical protein
MPWAAPAAAFTCKIFNVRAKKGENVRSGVIWVTVDVEFEIISIPIATTGHRKKALEML